MYSSRTCSLHHYLASPLFHWDARHHKLNEDELQRYACVCDDSRGVSHLRHSVWARYMNVSLVEGDTVYMILVEMGYGRSCFYTWEVFNWTLEVGSFIFVRVRIFILIESTYTCHGFQIMSGTSYSVYLTLWVHDLTHTIKDIITLMCSDSIGEFWEEAQAPGCCASPLDAALGCWLIISSNTYTEERRESLAERNDTDLTTQVENTGCIGEPVSAGNIVTFGVDRCVRSVHGRVEGG
ncbi:hypothetical protein Tco_1344752 [Tanacetum coccineum]